MINMLAASRAPWCHVGGQAVMDGLLLRCGDTYALAVRMPDGSVLAERRPWFTMVRGPLRWPFLRGFPLLIETLVNGIQALNRSADLVLAESGESMSPWQTFLTLFVALGFAILLFVGLPHGMAMMLQYWGMSSDVTGFSFHLWDGLFKFLFFLLYIIFIGFVPDIHKVFQYHGAEHKVIHAFESCIYGMLATSSMGGQAELNVRLAARQSRLHPRCGTTFLLFVITLAIVLHVAVLPPLLQWWAPHGFFATHIGSVLIKVVLIIPISALAYELIRFGARAGDGVLGCCLRGPGLLLQLLSTREPDASQMEVALVALREALLGADALCEDGAECSQSGQVSQYAPCRIQTPAYTVLE